jgi:hypothetical protein
MKATLTVLAGVGVWAAAAISAAVYIHLLAGAAILFAFFMYATGALMSAHSFFGYTVSMGGLYR